MSAASFDNVEEFLQATGKRNLVQRALAAQKEARERKERELDAERDKLWGEVVDFMRTKLGCDPVPAREEWMEGVNGANRATLNITIDGIKLRFSYNRKKIMTRNAGGEFDKDEIYDDVVKAEVSNVSNTWAEFTSLATLAEKMK